MIVNSDRCILHSDANAFFVSVETVLNPRYMGKAVAVCGSTEERHGIVLAKSNLAKRCGVRTGMTTWEAKKCCKDLVTVLPHYDSYVKFSHLLRDIYLRYTDKVEPFGMDECWLDVSSMRNNGAQIADEIRAAARDEIGLTVSVGVSFNKVFAKLGSDMKKPDATTVISADDFREKVWKLPVDAMMYCGRATSRKLNSWGIGTLGDVACADPRFLCEKFGKNGLMLWRNANGLDDSQVAKDGEYQVIKSVGHGETTVEDIENVSEVWSVLLELAQDVGERLIDYGLRANGVQLVMRNSELAFFQAQRKLGYPTQNSKELATAAFEIFKKFFDRIGSVRMLSVRAIDLERVDSPSQIGFFHDERRADMSRNFDATVHAIRKKYGRKAIGPALFLNDKRFINGSRHGQTLPRSHA